MISRSRASLSASSGSNRRSATAGLKNSSPSLTCQIITTIKTTNASSRSGPRTSCRFSSVPTLSTPNELIEELKAVALRVRNSQAEAAAGTKFANYKRALREFCPPELIDAVATIGNEAAAAVQVDERHEE